MLKQTVLDWFQHQQLVTSGTWGQQHFVYKTQATQIKFIGQRRKRMFCKQLQQFEEPQGFFGWLTTVGFYVELCECSHKEIHQVVRLGNKYKLKIICIWIIQSLDLLLPSLTAWWLSLWERQFPSGSPVPSHLLCSLLGGLVKLNFP